MATKTTCNSCRSKAIVYSSVEVSVDFSKKYCRCTNIDCGKTFVMNWSYSHDLSPSKNDVNEIIKKVLIDMGENGRNRLLIEINHKCNSS